MITLSQTTNSVHVDELLVLQSVMIIPDFDVDINDGANRQIMIVYLRNISLPIKKNCEANRNPGFRKNKSKASTRYFALSPEALFRGHLAFSFWKCSWKWLYPQKYFYEIKTLRHLKLKIFSLLGTDSALNHRYQARITEISSFLTPEVNKQIIFVIDVIVQGYSKKFSLMSLSSDLGATHWRPCFRRIKYD